MSQDSVNEIGGAHINPSARKSIHSNCSDCKTLLGKTMGRYGLNIVNRKIEQKESTANQDQGHDEVDNVMSKISRPASPVLPKRNDKYRRNSYDVNNEYSDDEDSDEDNILSKSSPAAFSFCSDKLNDSANATFLHTGLQNSVNLSMQQFSSEEQRRISIGSNNQGYSTLQARQKLNMQDESSFVWLKVLLVLLLICAAVFYNNVYASEQIKRSIYDKISFYNDFKDLGAKYKVKDTSILKVRTGVVTIFEKQDTGSFIFAYNSKTNHFNPVKFNSFVEDIAVTASKYLRNNGENTHHVMVDTDSLKMKTEKEFMNQYEQSLTKAGVMLVKDVDKIPSQLAMAFHYYCDEYSPLVKKSAIFFTLNLAKCSNNSDPKSTHEYIEKCLSEKWNTVGEDKIGPLLTRVVNIIVDVNSIT